uniref:Uncharacterized protein n=1 Tax=Compsopogon caeruleus TaxID=31354 RepID=A0A7S1XCI2_9RHOD
MGGLKAEVERLGVEMRLRDGMVEQQRRELEREKEMYVEAMDQVVELRARLLVLQKEKDESQLAEAKVRRELEQFLARRPRLGRKLRPAVGRGMLRRPGSAASASSGDYEDESSAMARTGSGEV